MSRTVLVCQNTTCRHQGSERVLTAFQAKTPSGIAVLSSGCLGQCGSGPMVRVLPDDVWYAHVQLPDVTRIVDQHLRNGRVVTQKLYSLFHPSRRPIGMWITAGSFVLSLGFLLIWMLTTYTALLARS